MNTTQASGAIQIIKAIADAIKELKQVPSGHLYAQVMGKMDIQSYNRIIDILKGAGLITEDSQHMLTWVG